MGSPETMTTRIPTERHKVVRPYTITLADFLQEEETKPASEYINGKIEQKPRSQEPHSRIQWYLAITINQALVSSRNIAYALPEVRCTFGGASLVPDLSVFQAAENPGKSQGNPFEMIPDWVIEILSPEQSQTKLINKIIHCLSYGCQLGWLINPKEDSVIVLFPEQNIRIYERAVPTLGDRRNLQLPLPKFLSETQIQLKLTVRDLFAI